MVIPAYLQRKDGTARVGLFAAAASFIVIILSSIFVVLLTNTAGALALPSVDVTLPTGKVLSPVTDRVNAVTDSLNVLVTVQSTPSTLGASVFSSLPLQPQVSPIQADVKVSLPTLIQSDNRSQASQPTAVSSQITTPVGAIQAATPESSSNLQDQDQQNIRLDAPDRQSNAPIVITASAVVPPTLNAKQTSALSGDNERSVAAVALTPLISSVASFIGSAIPTAFHDFVSSIANEDGSTIPYLISAAIFASMLGLIVVALYTLRNRQFVPGGGKLGQLAEKYDLTQFSVVAVVIIGSVAIVAYLLISQLLSQ